MRVIFFLLAVAASGEDSVAHRLPVASSVFPQGARPGQRIEAELLGEYLDRAISIAPFDDALQAEILAIEPTRLRLRISVSEKAAFGPHYFRVLTPRGASAPLLFRVGGLPRARDTEPNSTLAQAQPVSLPVTIDGRLNIDGDFDFYRFRANAGETWVFDLRAARNGNGLDAALILMDSAGVKLAHDEDQFIWDPFFTHTFASTGDFVAAIQPTHRSNDPNFAYELEIRRAPQLQTLAPLSLRPGATTQVVVFGAGMASPQWKVSAPHGITGEVVAARGDSAAVRLTIPAGVPEGVHELSLTAATGERSNPVRFLIDSTPAYSGSGDLKPPVSVAGIIRYRDPERFPFHAGKEEKLVFEVRSSRFGSPADPLIRILDSSGKVVASNDDFAFAVAGFYNKDPRLMHTFKEAGEYTLELRNLVNTTGENFPYQLLVTPPRPAFELAMASERPYVYPGQESKLKVTAARRDGHTAPIPLQLRGLPPGVSAEPAVIAEGANDVEVVLKAGPSAKPGSAGEVIIESGGVRAWRPVRISSGGGEGATFAPVDRALFAVVEKPSFSLEAAATSINLPRGGSAVIPVMIRREPGFSAPISFKIENLIPGITMEPATSTTDRVEIKLAASADVPRGRVTRVAVLGIAGSEQQEAPRINIQVD